MHTIILFVLAAAGAASAKGFDVASVTPEMLLTVQDPNHQSARSCLPYVAVGTHGGISPGLSGNLKVLDPLLKQLYSAPMFGIPGVYQAEFTWASLEPKANEYDFSSIREQLEFAKEIGLSLIVSVSTIDGQLVSVPPDFAGSDPTRLREGLHWNTTEVMERYLNLLGKVVPVMGEYGVLAHIDLGTNIDSNILLHPSTLPEWAQLIATAQYLGRNSTLISEYTSMGFSLTFDGVMELAGTEVLPVLLSIADSTPISYFPSADNGSVVPDPLVVVRDLVRFEAAMPEDRCLSIRSIGYPSGYNNASSVNNATYDKQADFYTDAVAAIRLANSTRTGPFNQPRFKAISFSNLADLPAELCIEYSKYMHDTSAAFIEDICTVGIVHANGKPKPAYEAFIKALKDE